jgi:flagellin-like protein
LAKFNTSRRRKTMKMKNLRKCRKAVSPVISVLLMIAVAVAASLITYAWVMGYLGSTTGKVGKAIQIQSMAKTANATGDFLTVWVQNVGTGAVTLDSLYVNGVLKSSGQGVSLPVNNTQSMTAEWSDAWAAPNTVDVKVVCSDGTFIEATQTVPSS